MDVGSDRYFKQWVRQRNVRSTTLKRYRIVITQYCTFHNLTPTELIQEARKEQIELPWLSDRNISNRLLDYYDSIEHQTDTTIRGKIAIIRGFYSHFEIALPKLKIKNRNKPRHETASDLPGRDAIRTALQNCNIKYQSIILFMASSGLSRADVIRITISDFLKAIKHPITGQIDIGEIDNILDKKDIELIGEWNGLRYKNNIPYITFSSPESTKSTLNYLKNMRKDIKQDQPLFNSPYTQGEMTNPAFENQFQKINRRSGFGWSGSHRYFTSHQLRRFFATTLTEHKVPHLFMEWMLGHKLPPVQGAYNKPSPTALKQEYLRVLPYLTFKEKVETRPITDEYVKKTDAKIKELQEELKKQDEVQKKLKKVIEEVYNLDPYKH